MEDKENKQDDGFAIETGVPMEGHGKKSPEVLKMVITMERLAKDQSFYIPLGDINDATIIARFDSAKKMVYTHNQALKFASKKVKDTNNKIVGIRIWRVA